MSNNLRHFSSKNIDPLSKESEEILSFDLSTKRLID